MRELRHENQTNDSQDQAVKAEEKRIHRVGYSHASLRHQDLPQRVDEIHPSGTNGRQIQKNHHWRSGEDVTREGTIV